LFCLGETVMAKRTVPLVIDVEPKEVPADAPLSTLVPSTVPSVVTHDGKIIPREAFARWRAEDIPGGFDTQHATINKAGERKRLLSAELALLQGWLDSFEPCAEGPRHAILNRTNEFLAVRSFPLPDSYDPDYIDLVLYVQNYPSVPPIGIYLLNEATFADSIARIRACINVFTHTAFHGAEPPLDGYVWLCLVSENWRIDRSDPAKGQNLMKYLAYFYGLLNE
jgi:hypothetical protein